MQIDERIKRARKRGDELLGTMDKPGSLEGDLFTGKNNLGESFGFPDPRAAILVLAVQTVFFGGLGLFLYAVTG